MGHMVHLQFNSLEPVPYIDIDLGRYDHVLLKGLSWGLRYSDFKRILTSLISHSNMTTGELS